MLIDLRRHMIACAAVSLALVAGCGEREAEEQFARRTISV